MATGALGQGMFNAWILNSLIAISSELFKKESDVDGISVFMPSKCKTFSKSFPNKFAISKVRFLEIS